MVSLDVIESCDGCGACCFEQGSPPGYLMMLCDADRDYSDGVWAEDFERFKSLPPEAMKSIEDYREALGVTVSGEGVCIWLDVTTRQCRHYEHRPNICRSELIRGDASCRGWREEYDDLINDAVQQ